MVIPMKRIPLDESSQQLVATLAALGNPARFRILEILAQHPQSIVADIVDRLPIAQATVSQHLQVLREAGIVYGERDERGQCCRIDFDAVSRFAQGIVAFSLRLAALGIRPESAQRRCTS